jgi:hypothetical protein
MFPWNIGYRIKHAFIILLRKNTYINKIEYIIFNLDFSFMVKLGQDQDWSKILLLLSKCIQAFREQHKLCIFLRQGYQGVNSPKNVLNKLLIEDAKSDKDINIV